MDTYDAIVIGAGHNGLIAATYLARAGMRTLLLEARDSVGGCASSEDVLGARVNICNCDHISFRSTPVMDELDLAAQQVPNIGVTLVMPGVVQSGIMFPEKTGPAALKAELETRHANTPLRNLEAGMRAGVDGGLPAAALAERSTAWPGRVYTGA